MELPQIRRPKATVSRSTIIGAAILALVTAPGTSFYLYKWVTTGQVWHLVEAAALFSLACFMGGSGGAAYCVVNKSRLRRPWRPFVALLAAMEAYLLAGSIAVVAIGRVAPALNAGLPVADIRFWLGLHGYAIALVVVSTGIMLSGRRCAQIVVHFLGGIMILAGGSLLALIVVSAPLDVLLIAFKALWYVAYSCGIIAVVVSMYGWAIVVKKRLCADRLQPTPSPNRSGH